MGTDVCAIEVILADDHPMVRQGLRLLLEKTGTQKVVGEASDGYEAVQLAKQLRPDVVVLDLSMPLLNGLDAAREIRKHSPRTNCLVLTVHNEESYVLEALQVGIRGYVVKSQAAAELAQAIDEVARGRIYLSPSISHAVLDACLDKAIVPHNELSLREREVLQLVAEGKTSKEIAVVLGLGTRTAESHRARIMKKLDIHDTAGLVRYAVRRGLVER